MKTTIYTNIAHSFDAVLFLSVTTNDEDRADELLQKWISGLGRGFGYADYWGWQCDLSACRLVPTYNGDTTEKNDIEYEYEDDGFYIRATGFIESVYYDLDVAYVSFCENLVSGAVVAWENNPYKKENIIEF